MCVKSQYFPGNGRETLLLRFGIENFLSINKRQEMSLIASSLRDDESGLIQCPAVPSSRLVPAAVIYGANASGKSNIVSAFRWLQYSVRQSHRAGDPEGGVPREYFALDPQMEQKPTSVDIDFVMNGVRYHYGFEATNEIFSSEWLYWFPKGRRQTLFEREGEQNITFGRVLAGRNKVIADLTRPNSLFVSAATQNDHEILSKVSAYISAIKFHTTISVAPGMIWSKFSDEEVDQRAIEFLKRIGTGIVDYRKTENKMTDEMKTLEEGVIELIGRISKDADTSKLKRGSEITSIELAHSRTDGESIYFELERESAGTRRLLVLLSSIYKALDNGTPIVIDELDASLHTQACEGIIGLFSNPDSNKKGAQLIATTHDTNLMQSDLLRRDQVYFTEKDAVGATHLYALSDIRTRKSDNFEKGYLQGRYGAVPLTGSVAELVAEG